MKNYFNCHTHTMYSNIRLLDSINRPEDVIKRSIELGLSGVAITDHECLSSHVEFEKLKEKYPDFKIVFGNEIYLTDTRNSEQKYYHFILLAKDEIGHRALRELSSTAWFYSYFDKGLERVPTLKSELSDLMKKFKGHLIATSACIGGELSSNTLKYAEAKENGDMIKAREYYTNIDNFIKYCLDIFGDDFYIECAPSTYKEQITVNKTLLGIAKFYKIKMVVGTDAHYLKKEDAAVHAAFLNSKGGERETEDFYKFTYLMDYDEVTNLLKESFDDCSVVEWILDNTLDIQNKIKEYSLFHKQDIPRVEVKDYDKIAEWDKKEEYPNLARLYNSDDIQDRYWVNQCCNKLKEINKYNKEYLDELEEEARVKSVIGTKLETNMFRYPNTLQHYINMIWESGSIVGAGRGSSCAALNHYLLGITQLDPLQWKLPFFRYLNDERVELGSL